MTKQKWYASTTELGKSGPYETQSDASRSVMKHTYYCKTRFWPYTSECTCELVPVLGAFVWPEDESCAPPGEG